MGHGSYMNVFAIGHEGGQPERIRVGDIVRMGDNHFPHFAVLAIHGDKVWVRNVESGVDGLGLLERCRHAEADVVAIAAE